MSDATTALPPRGPMRECAGSVADTVAIGYATTGHPVALPLRGPGPWTAGSAPGHADGFFGEHGVSFLTVL